MRSISLEADILIIGGGAAGCYAALCAARRSGARVLLAEKANIERSGCLAAGVNAVNAYIGQGHTPEDYVEYARRDAEGIVREDLLLTMAERLNGVALALEALGLTILKDEQGRYASRGWRNIKINGENIKPLLAAAVRAEPAVKVVNHVNVVSYLADNGRILGAVGFGADEAAQYVLRAPAVICATGGAAGLYRPNSPGFARQAMWYPPFNTGAGYAMGILAGAEMTALEMRFVALRCKDVIAPTGALAQGAGARQINKLGQVYEKRYGLSTSQRVYGTLRENLEGRGPCRLRAENLGPEQIEDLYRAYLNMAPAQTLKWVEESAGAGAALEAEIEAAGPYIVGGHTASGYWVDTQRRTTLRGLFAAGDVAGGCPQKYVSGAMAEAAIAAEAAWDYARANPPPARAAALDAQAQALHDEAEGYLSRADALIDADQIEAAMQKTMDEYAGGLTARYSYNEAQLDKADGRISELTALSARLGAEDMYGLMKIHELRERLVVCRSLIAHLKARRETRWPGFGVHLDYPEKSENWLRHVNSRLEHGQIRIIFRDLAAKEARYEHHH
ncbi:MAG: adenylyl-sulfate reductase subunit alpha [Candidatus Adiutrix sp.]|jgi:adenylylsulfate reductase subunit A|nr:adenylyl-sulfate reductase subunit alpha [Candidatus Adiutrix sp.]